MKRTCSASFRNSLLSIYPGLGNNQGHWRHLSRLLFAKDYNSIPIGIHQILRDYEAYKDFIGHRMSSLKYINKFHKDVFTYFVSDYSIKDHICRTATVDFPDEVLELVKQELMSTSQKDRVLISNGNKVTRKTGAQLRKEDLSICNHTLKLVTITPLANKLLTYLNHQPPNRFNKVVDRVPEAMEALIDKDSNGNFIIDFKEHLDQMKILQFILDQPQPIYEPTISGNTVRVFQVNRGLQSIHSHLRHVLTQDWIEIDLQNAHLAIIAKLWNIPYIESKLNTGNSIWSILMPDLELKGENDKDCLKTLLYACVYGMSFNNLTFMAESYFGTSKAKAFLSHPIIESIIEGKKRKLKELSSVEEYKTILDVIHKPLSYTKEGQFISNLLSIIAEEISEYEMLLLEPIFDYAIANHRIAITLYQFDGLSIEVRDKSRISRHLKVIRDLVNERAEQLNIHTKITVKR